MSFSFLFRFDRWTGICLLHVLALPTKLVGSLLNTFYTPKPLQVFLKLKGGGSLIIAMPALMGMREKNPDAKFVLVCAEEARVYAELTGLFDRYVIISDRSLVALVKTALHALGQVFRCELFVDLEPNSWLAAVFTMLSCGHQRIGLVRHDQQIRTVSYTNPLAFNTTKPIYLYYDKICSLLGGHITSTEKCRTQLKASLPTRGNTGLKRYTIGLAAFTSDFAKERMMAPDTWSRLLQQTRKADHASTIMIFGAGHNKAAARALEEKLGEDMPDVHVSNLSGRSTLAETVALMTSCDEVWAVDSGLLHLARLLGLPTRSFWGPTMPTQRLRPIHGLVEDIQYRLFLCSPCMPTEASAPPCRGYNLCMLSMCEKSPNLHPSWVRAA